MGGGATKMAPYLFVCTFVIKSINQQSKHRSLIIGGQGLSLSPSLFFFFWPTLAPASYVQVVPAIHAQLPARGLGVGEWVAATVLRAETDQN